VSVDEAAWKAYFQGNWVELFHVVYEDLVWAPEGTAVEIPRYLEIPLPEPLKIGVSRLQKHAYALSEAWVERYTLLKLQQTAR
jgi:LPS sulfotransferase NodH